MEEKLKIKLSIADRVYPLTVSPGQEEGLRRAAKQIEELIKKYEMSYAVRDKQDVLAMCALQFASKIEQGSIDTRDEDVEAKERLEALNQFLAKQLSL